MSQAQEEHEVLRVDEAMMGYYPHLPRPSQFMVEASRIVRNRFQSDRQRQEVENTLRRSMRDQVATQLIRDHFTVADLPHGWEVEYRLRVMVMTPAQFYALVEAEVARRERQRPLDIGP